MILFHRISPYRCHRLTERNQVQNHRKVIYSAPNFHLYTKSKGLCTLILQQVLLMWLLLTLVRREILDPRLRLCSKFLNLKSAVLVSLSQSNPEIHNCQLTVVIYNHHQDLSIPKKIFSGHWLGIDRSTITARLTIFKVDPTKIMRKSKLWGNKAKQY